ncbi:hypothetical protein M0R45_029354 [Rubus argutus]|uniref:Protein kinase domain-containing protein n=1 Tax=Rubus argutus TaxID=59490 RepID=A0AAW1W9U8_RUBAR
MHNGTLKEHLYGPLTHEQRINWIKRLEIAEDAAKGIEYLHTGCFRLWSFQTCSRRSIHVSSIVRGTVGYLDPEYYISQQLTDKSDVYIALVQWVSKLHIESGDIQGIIDPSLHDEYDIQSMWKIAEKALMCVQAHGYMRPSISESIVRPTAR